MRAKAKRARARRAKARRARARRARAGAIISAQIGRTQGESQWIVAQRLQPAGGLESGRRARSTRG